MGHSQNIRDWFGDDFCWRAMARGDRFAAMALLGGIRCAHGDGNQFRHHHSCSYSRHALVQPLSWKDHGDDAIGFWIRGFFRCTADQPDPNGEWRKLAASVDDCGRDFRLVRNCRVSVCEGASRRSGPNGGRRAGCGAIGEGDGGNCTGDKISVGPPTGLRNTRVLDDTCRGGGLPIPVFFLYGPLAAPLERSRRASRRRRIRHGSLHAGGRVWPADWWLADGRHGGAIRVSPVALWIAYSAAILYGTGFGWTFICLNTVTGHYYGPAAFPKVSGMTLVLAALFCAPAGYLGGKLFDLYHSYKLAFELNSAVAAIGVIALFFARMPEPPVASSLEQREQKKVGWETRIRT